MSTAGIPTVVLYRVDGRDMLAHPAAHLFPMLEGDSLRELVEDIRTNGLHEPVWLYDEPDVGTVLLDGRNRAAACVLAGVPVTTRCYSGSDPIAFSLSANDKRRHLTVGQRAGVGAKLEPMYAAEAAKRKAHGQTAPGKPITLGADLPQAIDPPVHATQAPVPSPVEKKTPAKFRAPRARDQAAKAAKTSGRSVAQYKRVAAEAPDLAEQIDSGKIALDRAERVVRDRQAEQRRVQQAQAEAAEAEVTYTVDIRHGDFRDALADIHDVDAIITDPPYPHEFIPLLGDLAAWADKVLRPDGILAVLIGQSYLPEVYRLLDGHRDYRWTGCYLTTGPAYVSHHRCVQSQWKPLLVYGGGPRFSDVIKSSGDDKAHHKWGQNYDAFHTIIERLTLKGETIVDPFMGAGTTLLAGHALGRHVIGCDVDPEAVQTATERLI